MLDQYMIDILKKEIIIITKINKIKIGVSLKYMAVKIVIILNILHIYVLDLPNLVSNKSDINNFT